MSFGGDGSSTFGGLLLAVALLWAGVGASHLTWETGSLGAFFLGVTAASPSWACNRAPRRREA